MTYYFEIRNTKTGDTFQGYGPGVRSIALQAGWRVRDCKCICRAPAM